ncbi:MAG: 6-phosphogluconate dehydrogenase [Bacteroidia bacterium]
MAYFIAGLSYSDGTRSGILTKVSRKGYIFKTYEGELNIGGIDQGDGTIMPLTIFKFSVKDKETYLALDSLQGKKIIVHYNQVMKNFFWQGESDYFVYKVKRIPK